MYTHARQSCLRGSVCSDTNSSRQSVITQAPSLHDPYAPAKAFRLFAYRPTGSSSLDKSIEACSHCTCITLYHYVPKIYTYPITPSLSYAGPKLCLRPEGAIPGRPYPYPIPCAGFWGYPCPCPGGIFIPGIPRLALIPIGDPIDCPIGDPIGGIPIFTCPPTGEGGCGYPYPGPAPPEPGPGPGPGPKGEGEGGC